MVPSANKTEKFERLAEKRMVNALRAIRLIGNLSNRGNYAYTAEHVSQMMRALKEEMKSVEARFADKGNAPPEVFRFKSQRTGDGGTQ